MYVFNGIVHLEPAFCKCYIVLLLVDTANKNDFYIDGKKAIFMLISIDISFCSPFDNSHKLVPAKRIMFIKLTLT